MATLLHVTVSLAFALKYFYSALESKRFREANGNRNRYSNKINIYSFTLVHLAYDQMRMGHASDVMRT